MDDTQASTPIYLNIYLRKSMSYNQSHLTLLPLPKFPQSWIFWLMFPIYLMSMNANSLEKPAATISQQAVKIVVDISEQKLYLYNGDEQSSNLIKNYPISTAKAGIGNRMGSGQTPLGLHRIEQKIGDGEPLGMIFKARRVTGIIAEMNGANVGDLVTTRIIWLKGLEPGRNAGAGVDSFERFIYIHGTAEENKIGQPASHGCIRMLNKEVVELFDQVVVGTPVQIRE
jgi:hypothetical protein